MSFSIKMKFKKKLVQTSTSLLVILLLLFSIPQITYAQFAVAEVGPNLYQNTLSATHNVSETSKDFVLDGLAWAVSKQIVAKLTAQTVKWINTGFKGNPAYVTNPDQFFLDIGDKTASIYLTKLSQSGTNLCSPFKAQVRIALVKNYLAETSNDPVTCSLGKLENNYSSFVNNFNNGGWDTFLNITQNNQNNPYGVYLDAQNKLNAQVGNEQLKAKTELTQGKGFLSYKTCKKYATSGVADNQSSDNGGDAAPGNTGGVNSDSGQSDAGDPGLSDASDSHQAGDCIPGTTQTSTPGSVIEAQLEESLGNGVKELNLVNSINQVVGALVTQLISQVVGGAGQGLRSLSDSGSGTNGRSFSDQLSTEATSVSSDVTHTLEIAADPSLRASVPAKDGQPFILLKGTNPINLYVNDPYIDPGATAFDSLDGDISQPNTQSDTGWSGVISSGVVDTQTPGTYNITYSVSNSKGVAANTVTRQVIVKLVPTNPTCTPPDTGTWPACSNSTGLGGGTGGGSGGTGGGTGGGGTGGGTGGGDSSSNVTPTISGIQGYTPSDGTSSNFVAGGSLILHGNFPSSGVTVTVNGQPVSITSHDTTQIVVKLSSTTGNLPIKITNTNNNESISTSIYIVASSSGGT